MTGVLEFEQGAHDEALTPASDTGDDDIDPGSIRLVLVEPRPIQGAAVREMLERVDCSRWSPPCGSPKRRPTSLP